MAAPTDSIEISAMTDGTAAQATDSVPARRGAGNVYLTLAYIKTFVLNALTLAWSSITGTPTTLAGYGITDAASSSALSTHAGLTTTAHGGIVASTDPALTNARTPTAHATSHQSGGSDALALGSVAGSLVIGQVPNSLLTYAKLQDVSATDKVLGRSTAGAGVVEEIAFTSVMRALADDTTVAAQRATLDVVQASTRLNRLVFSGTTYWGVPGVILSSQSTSGLSANEVRYFPFYVDSPITAAAISLEITTQAAAGKLCRMGICTVTPGTFLPLAALVDAGTVAADTLGVKTITINQALAVGAYALMVNTDGTPTLRTVRGQPAGGFVLPTMGSSAFAGSLRAAQTFGTFPTPTPTAPTSLGASSAGWEYCVALQW